MNGSFTARLSRAQDISPPHNLLGTRRPALEAMLSPRTVALIGATESAGSVGRSLLENLSSGQFKGIVYPVNLTRKQVLGRQAFKHIGHIPAKLDLAIIATPAATVPALIGECAAAGVKGAIIISAGFKEIGACGAELERQVAARRGTMRILGPNCLGAMIPHSGLNATFAASMANPGSVGFLSQSGALCTAVLDWSFREHVGFSAFLSVGSMLDVGWGDLIYYLGDDPHTRSIVIYMESIGNARAFLSAAREVALTKPIVVIKVGRSAAAAKAAISHTGSLVGDDAVIDAAFRRVGVLRVESIAELFAMAEVLAKQPRPRGPRLAIVTNAGGPGGLATDRLIAGGAQLAELSSESIAALSVLLPPHWSHHNPVDILGDASAQRYEQVCEIVSRDANADGTLVILTPQSMTDSVGTATRLAKLARESDRPLLTSWMGGSGVEAANQLLNDAGIPTFEHPDTAAGVFANMWRYSYHLRSIYETPALSPGSEEIAAHRAQAEQLIRAARKTGRTLLTEPESMQLLAAYGIPTIATQIARSPAEAAAASEALGYPVVLKLYSKTITHKSEVGGVKLNLCNARSVCRAYREIQESINDHIPGTDFLGVTVEPMIARDGFELILGSSTDAQFGPVLLFGAGGKLVEVFRDRALGLPPLTATLARRMMEQTHIYQALNGSRGLRSVDLNALEQLLVRFSHLVAQQRLIREIDLNPLLASAEGLIALDARVILHNPAIPEAQLPTPAIQPYPTQYIQRWRLKNGRPVLIRPIRPEDEPRMVKFHATLSGRSVHFRYFSQLKLELRVAHERLARICFNDYDRELALIADYKPPGSGQREIIGVGRLSKLHGLDDEAEFALIISDRWQGQGLGTKLLSQLVEIGRQESLTRIVGHILPDNSEMKHLCRKLGFTLLHDPAAGEMRAEITL